MRKTFISRCPPAADAGLTSLAMTQNGDHGQPSACVGLTLPGMIEEPGSVLRQDQFASPARPRRPGKRDVVGDLVERSGEAVRSAPEKCTSALRACAASNLFGAGVNGRSVSAAIPATAASAKPLAH